MTDRRPFDYTNDEDFAQLPIEAVNEVIPHLLQGDADLDPPLAWRMGVRVLVNLTGQTREPVKVPAGCLYLGWRIEDDPRVLPDTSVLRALGLILAERVRAGETVAVYCAGGLNRSGLLVGQTLIELGYRPAEAVERVRDARGRWALSNPAFESFLLEQAGEPR